MIQIKVNGKVIWEAWPKQEEALVRTENEILYGGARGGAKTACGIVWLLMGNQEPTGTIADGGYYLHPQYRALVLRKNITDMGDWIHKAKQLYGQLGATHTDRPNQFVFPSGATIVIGHLDDEDAFEKYQGQEFARILIEELTQISSEDLYLKVRASCRCPFDELRYQMFLTANPGGKGHQWVRDRFVSCTQPSTVYTEPNTGMTRIFIPARVKDNPIYANDPNYVGTLMGLSPAMRRAWFEGDWDAIAGQYFDEFRLKPGDGEPEEARHVIHSSEANLQPWYHRWMAVDWGYTHKSAVYKACLEPNGRVHVYGEMVVNRTSPEELGVEIARFIWPDIASGTQKTFTLLLSPDAFGRKTEERTVADQMAIGIEKILGPNSVYILDAEADEIHARKELQTSASIMIQRAANQRVAGWMYAKSLLRWWPIINATSQSTEGAAVFNPSYALDLFAEDRDKWRRYCALFKNQEEEVLPGVVIHGDQCPKLVRAIPLARANDPDKGDPEDVDKRHFEGMDEIDAWRYLLFGRKQMLIHEPFESYFAKHLQKHAPHGLSNLSGDSKVQMAMKAERDYKKMTEPATKPFYFPRSHARQRRRGVAR